MTTLLLGTIMYNADPSPGVENPVLRCCNPGRNSSGSQLPRGLHKAAAFHKVSSSVVAMPNLSGCLGTRLAHHNAKEQALLLICPSELPAGLNSREAFHANGILTHQLSLLGLHCLTFHKSVSNAASLSSHTLPHSSPSPFC